MIKVAKWHSDERVGVYLSTDTIQIQIPPSVTPHNCYVFRLYVILCIVPHLISALLTCTTTPGTTMM